ncbi:MAG TPA: cadherin-like domain-containing protein [Nitrososphaerales archaeon]
MKNQAFYMIAIIPLLISPVMVSRGTTADQLLGLQITPEQLIGSPVIEAGDDRASTQEDNSVKVDVLANDYIITPLLGRILGRSLLDVTHVSSPSNGVAVINTDSTITYTPNENFFGSDQFQYTVSDKARVASDSATVFITISPVNDPPIAVDDKAATNEDTPVGINVLANDYDVDGDKLTVVSVTQGANGSVELFSADSNGFVIYLPNRRFSGQDSFTYTISDGNGGTATAKVSVTVNPVDHYVINKRSSGLVASDSLTTPKTRQQLQADQSYWLYYGSAVAQNAPVDFFQDAQGLHIGVQAVSNGAYAGFYAVNRNPHSAFLWHAVITTPVRTIPSNFFQNGLYVQTDPAIGLINYVTCVSITSMAGTTWHIIRTEGNRSYSTLTEVLWSDPSPNQPLTRDCTMITNGNNYLKVYLDGVKVYESRTLQLKMPPPFQFFLEPQNSYAGQMPYGIYGDYYVALDENIKVINAPSNAARVDMVDASGNVLASAPLTNGVATLDVGRYHFPLAAFIRVYDGNGMEIASSSASIVGGDLYAVDFAQP